MTMRFFGGCREGVGLKIIKTGLFRTFCICPDPSKEESFCTSRSLMVTWFHRVTRSNPARIHNLLLQSEFCISVPEFILRTNVSGSYLFLLSLHT